MRQHGIWQKENETGQKQWGKGANYWAAQHEQQEKSDIFEQRNCCFYQDCMSSRASSEVYLQFAIFYHSLSSSDIHWNVYNKSLKLLCVFSMKTANRNWLSFPDLLRSSLALRVH